MRLYFAAILFLCAAAPAVRAQARGDGGAPLKGFVREKAVPQEPAPAAPPPAAPTPPAKEALEKAAGFGSVHALLPRAYKMARQWSPGAALYSLLGGAPRNERMLEPEKWTFIFGNPGARSGRFRVRFADQAIEYREGISKGVQMEEFFAMNAFSSRKSQRTKWQSNDYKNCRAVGDRFTDSLEIEKLIQEQKFPSGQYNQYRMTLLRPLNDHCDGLGIQAQFLTEKPIPRNLRGKALWVITNATESIFLDAQSGRLLLRRSRKQQDSGAQALDTAPGLRAKPRASWGRGGAEPAAKPASERRDPLRTPPPKPQSPPPQDIDTEPPPPNLDIEPPPPAH
ncbi:MAG: hypothetical protein ABIJ96_10505 [Elusimicrobiota bacterium]